jgi:glycosyltransferase involved in cell wall biosynthesis
MVSVITPVFNASLFLEKAIKSVLIQSEVSELILIDDGSTDNSWEIIQAWRQKDNRIVTLQHPDKQNHGRSATRNLGIKKATGNFIAFLDADDFYLENRFKNDIRLLEKDLTLDGIYNAIGAFVYDDFTGKISDSIRLTTIKERVGPDELYLYMNPLGSKGWFSGDGLTVRKDIFDKVGLFNEYLPVGEDTELWCKMALKTRLGPGIIDEPVAMRGLHGSNIFNRREHYIDNKFLLYKFLFNWAIKSGIHYEGLRRIIKKRDTSYLVSKKKGVVCYANILLMIIKSIISKPVIIKYYIEKIKEKF